MPAKRIRFGLGSFFGVFTIAAIVLGFGAYFVKSYREEQVRTFQRAYLEGRVSRATAREPVGKTVDSWPVMPPIRPSRQPWRERQQTERIF
jgi:hypothetical protein